MLPPDLTTRQPVKLACSSAGANVVVRVVIADDHAALRERLKRILDDADDLEVVGEAANGFEALDLVRKGALDVLTLDFSMPGPSGVELIRRINDEMPKLPILVLTMHREEQYAIGAIRAGARGYLTKDCAGTQLVSAIRKVASGNPYINLEDVAAESCNDFQPRIEEVAGT